MMKKATIKDVADLAGVSVATVSNFMNGVKVREANHKSIQDAVERLQYAIDFNAKSMRTQKTNTIGVIVPHLDDIYTGSIIAAIENTLAVENYHLLLCDSRDSQENEINKMDMLMKRCVDGIILYPSKRKYSGIEKILKGKPLITIDNKIRGTECDQVITNDVDSVYRAVQELINHGHKKIALINSTLDYYTAEKRYEGYRRAMEDADISLTQEYVINRTYELENGYTGMKQLLELNEPPTAVIGTNYSITIGIMKCLGEKKIKLGEQISVIGFDYLDIVKAIMPNLYMINRPIHDMGRTAAELMLRRLKQDDSPRQTVILENQMICGQTIGRIISN